MNLDIKTWIPILVALFGVGGIGAWARLRFDARNARRARIGPAQVALLSAIHDVQRTATVGGWLEGGNHPAVNQLADPSRRLAEALDEHRGALLAERRSRWAIGRPDGRSIVDGVGGLLRDIQELQYERQEHPKYLKPYHEEAENHAREIERIEKAIAKRSKTLTDALGRLA
jgi:hypothetical protein